MPPYHASIVRGRGEGTALGFPTYNLVVPTPFPEEYGIYAGWVWINQERYPGAFHYGPIPVFDIPTPSLEVFVLDYTPAGEVSELTFQFTEYVREIRAFPSPQALSEQIKKDVQVVRQKLGI